MAAQHEGRKHGRRNVGGSHQNPTAQRFRSTRIRLPNRSDKHGSTLQPHTGQPHTAKRFRRSEAIEGTVAPFASSVEDQGVDHRHADVPMTEVVFVEEVNVFDMRHEGSCQSIADAFDLQGAEATQR